MQYIKPEGQISMDKWYVTKGQHYPVVIHEVRDNGASFPVKGTILKRSKNFNRITKVYQIWQMNGSFKIFGEFNLDLLEVVD